MLKKFFSTINAKKNFLPAFRCKEMSSTKKKVNKKIRGEMK